jgi:hypothetical protein
MVVPDPVTVLNAQHATSCPGRTGHDWYGRKSAAGVLPQRGSDRKPVSQQAD